MSECKLTSGMNGVDSPFLCKWVFGDYLALDRCNATVGLGHLLFDSVESVVGDPHEACAVPFGTPRYGGVGMLWPS